MRPTTMIALILMTLIIGIAVTQIFGDKKMCEDNAKHWKEMYENKNDEYNDMIVYIMKTADEKTKISVLDFAIENAKQK